MHYAQNLHNRNLSDDIGTKVISNTAMAEINAFCERDNAVRICKANQDAKTFSNEFVVGLFSGSTLVSEISALNSDPVKRALQNFFLLAHDFIVRFQFIGLYYVKNINAWTEKITSLSEKACNDEFDDDESDDSDDTSSSDDNQMDLDKERGAEEEKMKKKKKKKITVNGKSRKLYKQQTLDVFYRIIAENLPFGVIPFYFNVNDFYGQYNLIEDRRTMKRSIIFEPFDTEANNDFEFEVMDAGVKFIAVDDSPFSVRNNVNNEVVPLSPFIDLLLQSELILEAETHIFDYNSMQVYKEEYAIALPQTDGKLSGQSDTALYSINSILGVKQMENREREDLAMRNAADNINRLTMENSLYRPSYESNQPSIGVQRLMANKRPQRIHFLKHIPKSVQIPTANHPAPTHNVEQMRSKYDNDVCAVMSLPFIYYKPFGNHHNTSASTSSSSGGFSGGGGGGGGGKESTSKLEFTQKLLDEETKSQHRLYNEILRNMYGKTLGKLGSGLFRSDIGRTTPPQKEKDDGKIHAKKKTGIKSVSISTVSKDIGKKIEIGIDFDKIIVKNDDAVSSLLAYYQAGLIDGHIIRKFLYQNFDITDEDPMKDPVNNPFFNASKNDAEGKSSSSSDKKKPKKAVKPNNKVKKSGDGDEEEEKKKKDKKKDEKKQKKKKEEDDDSS